MFDVEVSPEVVAWAEAVVSKYDLGQRRSGNGTREQQITGLVGEVMVQDLFRHPRTDGASGPDGGADLVFHGLTIDVKTMGRNHRPRLEWVSSFPAAQTHFPTRIVVFCSLNRKVRVLTVCGWTLKDLLLREATFYQKGSLCSRDDGTSFPAEMDHFEIAYGDLYSPATLYSLRQGLADLAVAEGRCTCEDEKPQVHQPRCDDPGGRPEGGVSLFAGLDRRRLFALE